MESFLYDSVPFPIRPELIAANRRTWECIANPGSWWHGSERVAIAAEVRLARTCALCRARKQALSPHAVDGRHPPAVEISAAVVDAVHRIVTDPARLTRDWLSGLAGDGLSDSHAVELLAIVVWVVCIDTFHEALGLPLEPLPTPRPGTPDGYRPSGLSSAEAWVPMLGRTRMAAAEADLFGDLPHAPMVLRALSLVPDAVRRLRDLDAAYYLAPRAVMNPRANGGRSISRRQMELIAARVSAFNECFY